MARDLIARFESERLDWVVVNAAGCGTSMKEYGRLLSGDPAWGARAEAFSARVKDVTELLVLLGPVAPRGEVKATAACHDACHLVHGQGIRTQPRRLLGAIPGLELVEIPDAEQCCGSAGVYNLLRPEEAEEIGRRKAASVLSTGADLLISANPGCTLQIQRHLRETGRTIRAMHTVELLDASIRAAAAHRRPELR